MSQCLFCYCAAAEFHHQMSPDSVILAHSVNLHLLLPPAERLPHPSRLHLPESQQGWKPGEPVMDFKETAVLHR